MKEFIAVGMLNQKNMNSQLIKRARELAFSYHKNQKYGSHPYSYHLQNVVNQVRIYSSLIPKESMEDAICVAYLHDILEDTLCTQDEILRALNPKILLAVKLLTKNGSDFESYFRQVAQDDLAIFVKLCDRYCNILESIQNGSQDKLAKYEKQNPKFIEILFQKNYIDLLEEIEFLFDFN
jgi:(p)ppGpp synthase/HD superfamily hydrolase